MNNSSAFIRTDKAIMIAFIELLKIKSFEKITVQDILEQTPVTRATFYAHYRDKHEIAEKMYEHFIELRTHVREELSHSTSNEIKKIVRHSFITNKELITALLKIHTETVDICQNIIDHFVNEYLEEFKDGSPLSARIYAQARAELEIALMKEDISPITLEEENEIYLDASLKLLRLSDDYETKRFLKRKLNNKEYK